tara:strand:- start:7 stop:504 length:498 start_codon:yes stop_codon:yes gene_type:complete
MKRAEARVRRREADIFHLWNITLVSRRRAESACRGVSPDASVWSILPPARRVPAPGPIVKVSSMSPVVWVLGSAACYAAAMIALKAWGFSIGIGGALCVAAFLLGAAFEAAALREVRLGVAYAAIIAVESAIVLVAGLMLFGETYSYREIAGGAFMLFGVALLAV